MKLLALASMLGVVLCLSACVAQHSAHQDQQIFDAYLQGHMQMLSKEAPWMSETQRLQHGRAQAAEIVKHFRQGSRTPLVVIPIPEAPTGERREPAAPPPPSVATAAPAAPGPRPAVRPEPVAKVPAQAAPGVGLPANPVRPARSLNGTYVLQSGSYSMQIEQVGNDVAVIEPNKRSLYSRQGDGSYRFHNPNTGSTFSLRFTDENTVEADRVPSSGSPSVLRRAPVAVQASANSNRSSMLAVAERYKSLALSDSVNVQAWAFCGSVAFKRSQSDEAEVARYASQAAQSLRQLGAATNPCPDAIPMAYW